jgi:UDP-N-acetylglucosamine:LPS N-acetylglucosamine transferase
MPVALPNDFALQGDGFTDVLAPAGRDHALRHTSQTHHGYDHRVSVLGYSTQMRELLCGADAFVTTTAGSSIQEARVCAVPTVCYGFPIAPIRDNVNAPSVPRRAASSRLLARAGGA